MNPNIPTDVLKELLKRDYYFVYILDNPNCSNKIIQKIYDMSDNQYIKQKAQKKLNFKILTTICVS